MDLYHELCTNTTNLLPAIFIHWRGANFSAVRLLICITTLLLKTTFLQGLAGQILNLWVEWVSSFQGTISDQLSSNALCETDFSYSSFNRQPTWPRSSIIALWPTYIFPHIQQGPRERHVLNDFQGAVISNTIIYACSAASMLVHVSTLLCHLKYDMGISHSSG